mgnify:CR=1 FL=1
MYCFQHSLSSLKNIIYYYSAVQVRTSITLKHGWPSFVVCTSLSVGIPSGFSFNHPFLYQVGTNPSCSSPSQSDISGASASKITSSFPCKLSSTTNFPFPNFSNLSRISSATLSRPIAKILSPLLPTRSLTRPPFVFAPPFVSNVFF